MVTDHKPLVKLFGDRVLDQITNSRLFSLKQRTLPWRFTIEYKPGKENNLSDATSRHPAHSNDEDDPEMSASDILSGIMVDEPDIDVHDTFLAAFCSQDDKRITAITWDY